MVKYKSKNNAQIRILTILAAILVLILHSGISAKAATPCSSKECFSTLLSNFSKTHTTQEVINNFEALSKNSNGMMGSCNELGRKLGVSIYGKIGLKAFNYFSIECGHSIEYGIFESYGKENPAIDENMLAKYCLGDSNTPSCTFGFGLAIAKYDMIKAQKSCERNFTNFDASKNKTASFQMTARGDCFNGYMSSYANTIKPIDSVKSIESICGLLPVSYGYICRGILDFSYLNNSSQSEAILLKKLKEMAGECRSNSGYECMQFVGKNVDQTLSYKLKVLAISKKSLALYANFINTICSGNNSKGCITGVIQSHIVHTSHAEMESICKMLKEKNYCLKTSKDHI